MSQPKDIAKRIWHLFTLSTPALRAQFLKNAADDPGSLAFPAEPIRDFSPFEKPHLERTWQIHRQMQALIKKDSGNAEGFNKALDYFESLLGRENADLLYYALQLFLVHYKGSLKFAIPSLIVREPELVAPSLDIDNQMVVEVALGSAEETLLDWFRESPSLNEHHEHWHVVYGEEEPIDRQGEMFFYMHQQMIARYNLERKSAGIAYVEPYPDFKQPIKVGYTPGPDERLAGFVDGERQPGAKVTEEEAQRQADYFDAVIKDLDTGYYDARGNSLAAETDAINTLGSTLEPNGHPQADLSRLYYGYHGAGHMGIQAINRGVMRTTVTAVRDVVFWEWHKGIDDLYFRMQERFAPYNFKADAPPVLLRKSVDAQNQPYSPDIILVSGASLPSAQACAEVFGATGWNTDFAKGSFKYKDAGTDKTIDTTDTLATRFKQGHIRYTLAGQQKDYPYVYLEHDPFAYFIRLENRSLELKKVTVRIFMVPEAEAENRRMWLEMDKFLQELPPQAKTVVFRKDTESSVIKKPHVADPSTHNTSFDPTDILQDPSCDCGWPYQMLLPSGSKENAGMAFKLMVMVSDSAIDLMEKEDDCGSFSFCAARSSGYPDRRPLGYPFNRKFDAGAGNILNTIRNQDNMACRTIYIKQQ